MLLVFTFQPSCNRCSYRSFPRGFILLRQLERLRQKRRENRQLGSLRRRPRVELPLVVYLQETVQNPLSCKRQLHFRAERKDLVLSTDEDLWKALDMVVGELELRVVHQASCEPTFEEIGAHSSLEVHGRSNLCLGVSLLGI